MLTPFFRNKSTIILWGRYEQIHWSGNSTKDFFFTVRKTAHMNSISGARRKICVERLKQRTPNMPWRSCGVLSLRRVEQQDEYESSHTLPTTTLHSCR